MSEALDPVLARRARIAHLVAIAKRIGYGALTIAIVAFVVGISTNFPQWLVTTTIAGLAVAIVVLPIPIVLGYGVRAADREERQAAARAAHRPAERSTEPGTDAESAS